MVTTSRLTIYALFLGPSSIIFLLTSVYAVLERTLPGLEELYLELTCPDCSIDPRRLELYDSSAPSRFRYLPYPGIWYLDPSLSPRIGFR